MKLKKWLMSICVLSFLLTLLIYGQLPDQVPRHWNIYGEVDAYMSRAGTLWLSLLPIAIYLMMVYLPRIDPRREAYLKHQKAYEVTQVLIVIFMIVIHWVSILYSRGMAMNISFIVLSGIGIMFIVMGNYMTQIRSNFFFGIKTPWTLSSDHVWRKTHRLGGYLFMGAGMVSIMAGFLGSRIGFIMMTVSVLCAALIPIVYSYVIYKNENDQQKGS